MDRYSLTQTYTARCGILFHRPPHEAGHRDLESGLGKADPCSASVIPKLRDTGSSLFLPGPWSSYVHSEEPLNAPASGHLMV